MPPTRFFSLTLAMLLLVAPLHAADEAAPQAKPAAAPAAPDAVEKFLVIPVTGTIGLHFTDALLEKCLKQAEALKPARVILEIDSPGGASSELDLITKRLVEWQTRTDIGVSAFIKPKAYSAATIIALACKDIYMFPASTIGSTAEVGDDGNGGKRDTLLRLKRESAVRAQDRALAQFGGHDPEIVLAMFEPKMELWVKMVDKKAVFTKTEKTYGKDPVPGSTMIKDWDKLLTLPAEDAAKYGFAAAVVKDYAAIGEALGHANWVDAGPRCRTLTQGQYRAGEDAQKELIRLADTVESSLIKTNSSDRSGRLADLQAASAATARITQITTKNPYLADSIDKNRLNTLKAQIDREIARERKR
jgi:hypothetical protein